ncbi:MAG: hypothetical protein JSV86_12320 [Gemmatimonadota bacterium]|nr:MAG: hypothetical protein JSV86_12320 [Gemmatimonadota bacterium]
MMDAVTLLKIAGAVLAFALGIWIGLGMPGTKRKKAPTDWQASDRLRATWINRVFFRMENPERRFGSGLITPRGRSDKAGEGQAESDSEESSGVVRLRRTGER